MGLGSTARSLATAFLSLTFAVSCNAVSKAPATALAGDAIMGAADAKVTLIEFAAPTCPVCKGWHDQVFAKIKAAYVDTNKIKFSLRELPSHNPPVDAAIFAIARCAGQGEYFKVIDEAFEKREDIEKASQGPDGARPALTELAKRHGVSADRFEACLKAPENLQRLQDVQADAEKRGVQGTPTLFLNDEKVPEDGYQFDALSAKIDAALNASAGAAPAPAAAPLAPAPVSGPAAPAPPAKPN
jgi:protein-disulfide isomerase